MKFKALLGKCRFYIIDLVLGTKILKILSQLEDEQYMPINILNQLRKKRLHKLFLNAQKNTIYYRFFPTYSSLEILDKITIKKSYNFFFSNQYKGKLYPKYTGGSTGIPFKYYTSKKSISYLWAGIILSWKAAGYHIGDKVAFVAGASIIKNDFKHHLFYKFLNIISLPIHDLSNEKIINYLNFLISKKIKYIYGYASAINLIANYIHQNNKTNTNTLKFNHLESIITTAEVLTSNMRSNIESAFNVKVFNQYGCNEAGISAFECEYHNLHLISSRSFYELDKDNNLISTDLSNDGFILLKYKTGDKVIFSDNFSCKCSRTYPIIEEVLGRTCDIISDKFGHQLHSCYFIILFRNDPNILNFQISYSENDFNIYLNVNNKFSNEYYYQKYIHEIKKRLTFNNYNIFINKPFHIEKNLKHKFIINSNTL